MRQRILSCISLLSFCLSAGCGEKKPAPAPPPPVPVTVAQPLVRQVIDWDEYTGRLEPVQFVELRARVSGYLIDAPLREGSIVKEGELLFVIDPAPYEARVRQLEGDVAKFKAQLEYATNELNRIAPLRKQGVASEKEYNDDILNQKTAAAALESAQAALRQAQLELEWTRVTAPIAGRVGRKLVTPGNLITGGAGQATLLTTITSLDPIYCYVDADEQSVLKYRRLIQKGKLHSAREAGSVIPCYLGLADEQGYPHEGVVDFVNNRLDPLTGTLQVRGRFPNPDGILEPGLFARFRIASSAPYNALLVADHAIGIDQAQRFVLVVGPDNKVEYRRVTVGKLFDGLRAILDGLKPDDWVIVNGLLKARPGMVVNPTRAPMPTGPVSAFAGASSRPAAPATSRPDGGPSPAPAASPNAPADSGPGAGANPPSNGSGPTAPAPGAAADETTPPTTTRPTR